MSSQDSQADRPVEIARGGRRAKRRDAPASTSRKPARKTSKPATAAAKVASPIKVAKVKPTARKPVEPATAEAKPARKAKPAAKAPAPAPDEAPVASAAACLSRAHACRADACQAALPSPRSSHRRRRNTPRPNSSAWPTTSRERWSNSARPWRRWSSPSSRARSRPAWPTM